MLQARGTPAREGEKGTFMFFLGRFACYCHHKRPASLKNMNVPFSLFVPARCFANANFTFLALPCAVRYLRQWRVHPC